MVEPGQILLGKYRVERLLGQGGMGLVIRAHHTSLEKPVAIKILRSEMLARPTTVKRFLREARAAAKLRSEHVCRVLDVGTLEDDAPYMVMEFMEGSDLRDLLHRHGRLAPDVAVDLMLQACEALAEAHSHGIIHRDLKLANLFLARKSNGSMSLKVLDFGISKAPSEVDEEMTQTHTILGTPAYMSPEQMRSAKYVDARSDIWSLGVVLFELLEGRRPFQGTAYSDLCLRVSLDPTPAMTATLPPGLDAVVARCLSKSPDQRYQNVAELAAALTPYSTSERAASRAIERMSRMLGIAAPAPGVPAPVATPPVGAPAAPARPAEYDPDDLATTLSEGIGQLDALAVRAPRRWPWLAAAAAVIILVAAGTVAFIGGDESAEPDHERGALTPAAASAPASDTRVLESRPIEPSKASEPAPTNDAGVAEERPSTAADSVAADQPATKESAEADRATASRTEPRKRSAATRKRTARKNAKSRSKPGKSDDTRRKDPEKDSAEIYDWVPD